MNTECCNALSLAAKRMVELEDEEAGDNEHGMLSRFEFGCQEDGRLVGLELEDEEADDKFARSFIRTHKNGLVRTLKIL